ncbi:MAG: 3-deoxy-D-manno-octulosonic acid transferase, partial [Cyclobacteriaceae bacterium]|nr:3-deoxy-D-manno-octulosonic acid transferase [Cyclobacteriaceae bacterium]
RNTTVAGDTRFDRVKFVGAESKPVPLLENFGGSHRVMVIGSCWDEDLELLIPFINSDTHDLKFILAPHEIHEHQLLSLEEKVKLKTVRYSIATPELIEQSRVVIIDSIGILNKLYKYGHYAYVGGAFGKGLHNILEPAAFGLPVFFGNKNYKKFREALELISLNYAFPVSNLDAFLKKYEMVKEEELRRKMSDGIMGYVAKNAGATEIIINNCFEK